MDELESHLDSQRSGRLSFWHEIRCELALDLLPENGGVVADIGAGAGLLGDHLASRHPDVSYRFVEPIESAAASLCERFGSSAQLDSVEMVRVADLVTVMDVIEHLDDDLGLLGEVTSNMRVGARLVVTVPAMAWLWSEWDTALGHRRRYTKRTLEALTSGLALRDVEVTYLFPELVVPAVVRRVAGGRVGGKRRGAVSEYPELPRAIDRLLYLIGSCTTRVRRIWPWGTSVVLSATRA